MSGSPIQLQKECTATTAVRWPVQTNTLEAYHPKMVVNITCIEICTEMPLIRHSFQDWMHFCAFYVCVPLHALDDTDEGSEMHAHYHWAGINTSGNLKELNYKRGQHLVLSLCCTCDLGTCNSLDTACKHIGQHSAQNGEIMVHRVVDWEMRPDQKAGTAPADTLMYGEFVQVVQVRRTEK